MSEKLPFVSVIMVVKNGEQYVRDALESIYNQDYPEFEVIVVDGRSEDKTISIVNEFDPDKIIIQNSEGISDAYNTGIHAANAEYLSFLSSDDLWMHDKLKTQIKYMLNHQKIMYTNSLIEYFLEPDSGIPTGFRRNLLGRPHPARIMENFVAKKEVFKKVGFYNSELSTAEDVDWFSRAQHLNIQNHVVEKVLLKKRIHGKNTSLDVEKNSKNLIKVLRKAVQRKRS
jgi:glycosyltransferase involved in cell wall biosynthesis